MEGITLGQISLAITFIVGLISGIGYLSTMSRKWIKSALKEELTDITMKLDKVDLESTKNYLVTTLADVERGKTLDEIEKQRFYEQYQHYQEKGGNSYIKHKAEEVKNKGWL